MIGEEIDVARDELGDGRTEVGVLQRVHAAEEVREALDVVQAEKSGNIGGGDGEV